MLTVVKIFNHGLHGWAQMLEHEGRLLYRYPNETVIVDPKVVNSFNDNHIAQMLGYLNIAGLKTALLLNFKHARLQIKRVSN